MSKLKISNDQNFVRAGKTLNQSFVVLAIFPSAGKLKDSTELQTMLQLRTFYKI